MKPVRHRRIIVTTLCAVSFALLLGWGAVTVIRPRLILRERLHHAMSLAVACRMYATEHDGKFPGKLEELVPDYISNLDFLVIPSSDGKHPLDLHYFGGRDTDPPETILIRISPEHPGDSEVIVQADSSGFIRRSAGGR